MNDETATRLRSSAVDTYFMHDDNDKLPPGSDEQIELAETVETLADFENFFYWLCELELEDRYSMIAVAAYAISNYDDDDHLYNLANRSDLTAADYILIDQLYADLKLTLT